MPPRRDDQNSRGGRPRTAPPRDRRREERRDDRGGEERRSNRGSQRGSNASVVSGGSGSYTERSSRGGERRRPKSQDGSGYRGDRGRGGTGDGTQVPIHQEPKDMNQFAMNSPSHTGGRLPNGRLLSGVQPEGMVFHPRSGFSRTQFGGVWEDHKTEDRPWPPQSCTKSGFSDFAPDEPMDASTYQSHFGITFDGTDTMGHVKPNTTGIMTAVRTVNGYGRSVNGGFFVREKLGDLSRYKHTDAWRAMPAWARGMPEPTRPGPGYTRNDQGGFFRT